MSQIVDTCVSTIFMSARSHREPLPTPWPIATVSQAPARATATPGVLEESGQGRVVRVNQAFCRLFGLAAPEPLTGSVGPSRGWIVPQDTRHPAEHADRVAALVASGVPAFGDEIVLQDGRVLRRDFIPLGADQIRAGYLWIFHLQSHETRPGGGRITTPVELALAGEPSGDNRDDLENQRRTQERLIHAGKMAAVGTLVAGLSHELNNPLGVILGYVQGLLRRTAEDAPARASLVAIERQAQRAAHLVRSLLDFSRQKRSVREARSLRELMSRACELAEGHARRFHVSLRLELGEQDITLETCPAEIESALLNLLTNAIDASPREGTIVVKATASSRGARSGVDIAVIDRGSGIAPDVLPYIFDPFFTTKPAGEGTGIGLPLSRQIVEAHDGTLDVDTKLGRGTTMHLWLPLRSTDVRA